MSLPEANAAHFPPGGTVQGGESKILHWLAVLVLAACIVRLWVMPLPSSFWVDEMGTAFVVRRGADEPTLRAAPQVPASVYYLLPAAMDRVFGLNETAYRLPSLLAMLAALWFLSRLAARLIHPGAAWFVACACFLLRGFNYQAADARPYALGTCVLAASLWLLVRWLDTGRLRHAAGFAILAALLWRIHLVFWPLYAVYGIYTAARLRRGDAKAAWPAAAGVYAAIALALLPVSLRAMRLMKEAGAHVVAAPPSFLVFVYSLKVGLVAGAGMAALVAGWMLSKREDRRPARRCEWSFLLAWWLAPPVLLFTFSWLTGHSIYVPRYLYLALPGAVLAAAAFASLRLPERHWKTSAIAAGALALALLGRWGEAWPPHHNSDWRAAAAAVNRLAGEADTAVLCPSPFIEAKPPVWSLNYPTDGFLYSHLFVYPIRGRIFPLPFDRFPAAAPVIEDLFGRTLEGQGRFILYGPAGGAGFWADWFRERLPPERWIKRNEGNFGDVSVFLFERTAQ